MDDQTIGRLLAISQGNIGAATVCTQLFAMEPSFLDSLEENKIFGPDLWLLYKDECKEDIAATAFSIAIGNAVDLLKHNHYSSFYVGE